MQELYYRIENCVKNMSIEDPKDSIDRDDGHDVDGDPKVPEEEEWKVSADMIIQAHKLTTTVEKSKRKIYLSFEQYKI